VACNFKTKHHPKKLREFIAPKDHKPRQYQLTDLIHAFHNSYYWPKKHTTFYYRLSEYARPLKQYRSEFRELLSRGCAAIVHYYNIATSKLGFTCKITGKWVDISYKTLAKVIDVHISSIKRLFSWMKMRKFISIKRKNRHDEKGRRRAIASEKTIHPSFFFETLGYKAWEKIKSAKRKEDKKEKRLTYKEERTSPREFTRSSPKTVELYMAKIMAELRIIPP
jgi:hypothetical protein